MSGDSLVPEGYVAFGWHTFRSLRGQAQLTVAHLAPAPQGERPWEALCGRRRRGAATRPDAPSVVESEMGRGERSKCARCFAIAAGAAYPHGGEFGT